MSLSSKIKPLDYPNKKAVERAVSFCLQQVPSLRADVDKFVANNGMQSTLLKLGGTIPITYQGNPYNIPVVIWIPREFPKPPPTCFVTPTQDMRIKPRHRHVDAQGMVYLPYLHEWVDGRSDLIQLVASMISVFSVDPPCFKKTGGHTQAMNYGQMGRGGMRYPQQQQQQPIPQQQNQFYNPRPQQQPHGGMMPGGPGGPGGGRGMAAGPGRNGMAGGGGVASSGSGMDMLRQPSKPSLADKKDRLIAECTAKLQTEMQKINQSTAKEIDELFEAQETLKLGSAKISTSRINMEKQKELYNERIKELTDLNEKIKKWVEEKEGEDEINVDEVLGPADTWSEQLFGLVAEDNAIDDALYELDNALENQTISLRDFSKSIRKLARDQFFLRAHIKKIYEKQSAQPNVPIAQPVSQQPVSALQNQYHRPREGVNLQEFLQH